MTGRLMIYGAYGYSGELATRRAVDAGMNPLLAGRNAAKTAALAAELGLKSVVFDLADPDATQRALASCDAVLNCAGPFRDTWQAMTAACLHSKTHYLDITGEVEVLAGCAGLDAAARNAGITIMPGVGFDVVPTDCLAAMLHQKLPDATTLSLAFSGSGQASRGTVATSVPFLSQLPMIRKQGRMIARTGPLTTQIDFGRGLELAQAISWGDVVTAWHSTGIPDIEVFMKPPRDLVALMRMPRVLRWLLTSPLGRPLITARLRNMPPGPDAQQRAAGRSIIWGRVTNVAGASVSMRMQTAEAYHLTGLTAARIAAMAAAGRLPPGFQTPSKALGPEFILGIEGSTMLE